MTLADIGVNLTSNQFDKDREQVLVDSWDAGIGMMVLTGTNIDESKQVLALSQCDNRLFATAGVHPHDAKSVDSQFITELAQLYQSPKVRAIGECGLDFNRDFSPRPQQIEVFSQQVALACDLGAPLFMHQRDAHQMFLDVIKSYSTKIKAGVVHCFTGTRQELEDYLELGFYIGITGWICDERRGLAVRELTALIPDDKLLIETDAPYLLPRDLKPKPKSRRNHPKYLAHILQTIAKERQQDIEQLQQQIWHNSQTFFQIGD